MLSKNQKITPAEQLKEIIEALRDYPGVTIPSSTTPSKKFGSSGLRINDKIFAMISSRNQFDVKLPRERVNELVASGVGEYYDPGHGRLMKEWLVVASPFDERGLSLAREAMEFVASQR